MQAFSLVFPLAATSRTLRLQLSAAGVGAQLAKNFTHFYRFLTHVWCIFGCRGVPGHPLASFCATPLPHDPPKQDFDDILGVPWGPFGTLVGPMFGSGRALETFGDDCSCGFVPFGRLPVSTSIGER